MLMRIKVFLISTLIVVTAVAVTSVRHQGIVYLGTFDTVVSSWHLRATGALEFISSAEFADGISNLRNPSWLVPYTGFLYCVNQMNDYNDSDSGAISVFKFDDTTGSLLYINSVASRGMGPVHASIKEFNASLALLYVSNNQQSVGVFPINRIDGHIGDAIQVLSYSESSYIHQVFAYDDNVIVTDRDLNTVYVYPMNPASGTVVVEARVDARLPAGCGPRHSLVHPFLPYMYVVCETDSSMALFHFSPEGPSARVVYISSVSMLPPEMSPEDREFMTAAEIQVSADGRFLYGSNRDNSDPNNNRSSIVVFSVNQESGSLNAVQFQYSGGEHPRHFNLFKVAPAVGSAEKWMMIVANKNSDNVATFHVNTATGLLTSTGHVTYTEPHHDEPVHIIMA
jgi:6-phosphogluconolactonase